MPKDFDIDMNELIALNNSGLSTRQLAVRFGVSVRTIKRKLKDDPVKQFASKLAELVDAAPEGYCRRELNRLIWEVRTFRATNSEQKKSKIVQAIRSEAREVEEIAEDAGLTKTETVDLLDELEKDRVVYKKQRGGTFNRGRKTKFHYFLIVTT